MRRHLTIGVVILLATGGMFVPLGAEEPVPPGPIKLGTLEKLSGSGAGSYNEIMKWRSLEGTIPG